MFKVFGIAKAIRDALILPENLRCSNLLPVGSRISSSKYSYTSGSFSRCQVSSEVLSAPSVVNLIDETDGVEQIISEFPALRLVKLDNYLRLNMVSIICWNSHFIICRSSL